LALRKIKRQACAEYISLPTQFLADRTIGRAIGTVCRLSSVTFSIVAKW